MAADERAGEELGGSSISFVLGTGGPPALGAGTPTGGGMAALLGPLLLALALPLPLAGADCW